MVLGATVAIGAGVAVWKLWGEEAWNSSQRTQRWGTDVGKATDEALTKFQGYSRGASGELDLLEKAFLGIPIPLLIISLRWVNQSKKI